MEEREVFSSNDELVVNQVCNILKENRIPCYKQESGAGSYMNIAYGKSTITKKKIIVSRENYEKAKRIIDFLSISEENENENNDGMPKELTAIKVDEFEESKYRLAS